MIHYIDYNILIIYTCVCGCMCIQDVTLLKCVEHLRKKNPNENLHSIHFYDEILAQPSGGTLATIFHILKDRKAYKSRCGYDPLLKGAEGKADSKMKTSNAAVLQYSSEYKAWVGPFVMVRIHHKFIV